MSWALRLKRVFGVEIESCIRCGGKLNILASIEEPKVIAKILPQLQKRAPDDDPPELPLGAWAPRRDSGRVWDGLIYRPRSRRGTFALTVRPTRSIGCARRVV